MDRSCEQLARPKSGGLSGRKSAGPGRPASPVKASMTYWSVDKWGLPSGQQAAYRPGSGGIAVPSDKVMDSLAELEEEMQATLSALATFNEDGKMVLLRQCRKEESAAAQGGQAGPPGLMSTDQFRHMWRKLGVRVSRDQAAGMFLRYGCDAQGLLPYEVFAAKLQGSPSRLLALEPHQKGPYKATSGDPTFKGKITYRYCRKPVFPPTNWDGSLVLESAKLPRASLALEWVYGYNGNCTAPNAFYTLTQKIVYYVAALGVVYDPVTHTQQFFQEHDDDITCLAIHPNRLLVATGQVASALDGTANCPFLHVWDATSNPPQSIQCIDFADEGDARFIVAMAFSPDGERLIVATGDNRHTVGVYDWRSKQLLHQGVGHNGQPPQVYGVVCNPFAPQQDAQGNQPPSPAMFVTYGVKHIKFWVAAVSETGKESYTTSQGKFKAAAKADVMSAVFLPSGWLVTGSPTGELLMWDAGPNRPTFGCCCRVIQAHSPGQKMPSVHDGQPVLQGVRCLALRRDNTELVSAGSDSKICFWDIGSGKVGDLLQTFQFQEPAQTGPASFRALDVRPGGMEVLVGTHNSDLWQINPAAVARTASGVVTGGPSRALQSPVTANAAGPGATLPEALIQGHTADVYGIAWHPKKPHVFVTACESNHVFVWHARRKQLMAKVSIGMGAHSVDFSPDAIHLAVGGVNGCVQVLLVEDMTQVVAQMHHCKEALDDLKYSPDGSKLAAGSHDNFIDIYYVQKGYQRIARCYGHSSYIRHIDWAANSRVLQSSCGAYELLCFDASTGKQVQQNQRDTSWSTYTNILGFSVMGIWPDNSDGTDVNAVCRSYQLPEWQSQDPLAGAGVGHVLATAGDDGRVRLLSYPCVVDDAPARVYRGHSSHVMNVRFSPHNKWVCSVGGKDRAVFQWKVRPELKQQKPQQQPLPAVVVTYPTRQRQPLQDMPQPEVKPPPPPQPQVPPKIDWDEASVSSKPPKRIGSPPPPVIQESPKPVQPQIPKSKYRVHVYTSDIRGAGTDANVSIKLVGTNGKESGLHRLDHSKNNFERSSEDVFFLELPNLGDLAYMEIGHDNSGFAPGWHLEQVIVVDQASNKQWTFACDRWLDKGEDDGLIWRRLLPFGESDSTTYRVNTHTSDIRGAGTNAGVYIELLGEVDAKSVQGPRLKLDNSSNNFERGAVDSFLLKKHKRLGRLTAVRIGHDNTGLFPGWHLDHVEVVDDASGTTYYFPCNQWLDRSEGDGAVERLLQVSSAGDVTCQPKLPYRVTVRTSDVRFAGTDANVFIEIMGEVDGKPTSSGRLPLNNSKNNFERNATDIFNLQLSNLGTIKRINIGHDNSGAGSAWHLASVEVVCMSTGEAVNFHYNGWLSRSDPPYKTEVELVPVAEAGQMPLCRYSIIVYTSDIRGAGTDAGVSCVIHGDKGCTPQLTLENSANNFERGARDEFNVQSVDVGAMQRLQIGHDNRGPSSAWHLQHVEVINHSTATRAFFYANTWLDAKSRTTTLMLEAATTDAAPLKNKWKISVQTRDVRGAGTNADISVVLMGPKGTSKELKLESSADNFERNKLDEFVLDIGSADIGSELTKLDIGFATKQSTTGLLTGLVGQQWGLGRVEVQHVATGNRQVFVYDGWVNKSQPRVLLLPGTVADKVLVEYQITVYTSDVRGAGTDANISIELHGDKDQTAPFRLENAASNFERGKMDTFSLVANDVGQMSHVVVIKEGGGLGSDWHLQMVEVVHTGSHQRLQFPFNTWLKGNQRIALKGDGLGGSADDGRVTFRVAVTTSDVRGAGTDANVSVVLFGDKGDTGERPLESSANDFERGKTDTFFLTSPDIGPLQSIRISHDGRGLGSAWHLSNVTVTNTKTGETVIFPYNNWLDEKHGTSVVLWPDRDGDGLADRPTNSASAAAEVTYKVAVYTSDIRGAGTDANVYVELHGSKGSLGATRLENAANNFERGKRDEFVIQGSDVGDISKLVIWHDNSGLAADWHLQHVEVLHPVQQKTYMFPCNCWLRKQQQQQGSAEAAAAAKAVGVPPGCLAVLLPAGPELAATAAEVNYKVAVYTSDIRGAGTDANVYVELHGSKGSLGATRLENAANNFERGKIDTFVVKGSDVGDLSKLVIWHDNSGLAADWHLQHVEVFHPVQQKTYIFPCNRWLGKQQQQQGSAEAAAASKAAGVPPGCLAVLLPAGPELAAAAAAEVRYKVEVQTSDIRGAGTDADVAITICGSAGDTGPLKLFSSANDFERGKLDTFFVQASDVGTISSIQLECKGAGITAAWQLATVTVTNTTSGQSVVFKYDDWFDSTKGWKQTLQPCMQLPSAPTGESHAVVSKVTYKVEVQTSDIRGAGTDADVVITIHGPAGDTGPLKLFSSANDFERGKLDTFFVQASDVGTISSIQFMCKGAGMTAAWHLATVTVTNTISGQLVVFKYNDWFDSTKGWKQMLQPCMQVPSTPTGESPTVLSKVTFKVEVQTSDIRGAGTDADVAITICGSAGDTGPLKLFSSANDFERGKLDTFFVQAPNVGSISSIQLESKGGGLAAAWHLATVTVTNTISGQSVLFKYNDWFDSTKGWKQMLHPHTQTPSPLTQDTATDRQQGNSRQQATTASIMAAESPAPQLVEYQVSVFTGDVIGAGTDGDVYLALKGDKGVLGERELRDSMAGGNLFERGRQDVFRFQASDIGQLSTATVRLVEKGFAAAWFLSHIEVLNITTGSKATFIHNGWVRQTRENPEGQVVIPAVKSSSNPHSIQQQQQRQSQQSLSQEDTAINQAPVVAPAAASATGNSQGQRGAVQAATVVPAAVAAAPVALVDTGPRVFKVLTLTSSVTGAGTDAPVQITVQGPLGVLTGGPINLSSSNNCFETGQLDQFLYEVPAAKDCGSPITQLTVTRGSTLTLGADWHLDHIVLIDESRGHTYKWTCRSWFNNSEGLSKTWSLQGSAGAAAAASPQQQMQLVEAPAGLAEQLGFGAGKSSSPAAAEAGDQSRVSKDYLSRLGDLFRVSLQTSDKLRAGGPGLVRLQLQDRYMTIWEPLLTQQASQFARGAKADFFAQCMVQLGSIEQLTLWHEGGGVGTSWHLQGVTVQHVQSGRTWQCGVNSWVPKTLDPSKGLVVKVVQVKQPAQQQQQQQGQPGAAKAAVSTQEQQSPQPAAVAPAAQQQEQQQQKLQVPQQQDQGETSESRSVKQPPDPSAAGAILQSLGDWQLCQAPHPEEPSLLVAYYYNSKTGVSQYEVPLELQTQQQQALRQQEGQHTQQQQQQQQQPAHSRPGQAASDPQTAVDPEPTCDWQLCQAPYPGDDSLLVTYYYNSNTGFSQYDAPAEYAAWQATHDAWEQRQQQ